VVFYRLEAGGILVSRILHQRMLPERHSIDEEESGRKDCQRGGAAPVPPCRERLFEYLLWRIPSNEQTDRVEIIGRLGRPPYLSHFAIRCRTSS
jgi:hypothetical protein